MGFIRKIAFVTFALFLTSAAQADMQRDMEAQQLVEKALKLYKVMNNRSFGLLSDPNGQFRDEELYIFVIDAQTNVTVAHGGNPSRIGSVITETDDNGRNIGEYVIGLATSLGGWVEYEFENPVTMMTEPKKSWVVLHDGYLFGSGVYGN